MLADARRRSPTLADARRRSPMLADACRRSPAFGNHRLHTSLPQHRCRDHFSTPIDTLRLVTDIHQLPSPTKGNRRPSLAQTTTEPSSRFQKNGQCHEATARRRRQHTRL
ncbi:hypothetical protein AURDEDRAFT_163535 [Auricularia subglabra TFB-10046 SS5]|nr:hypothetical protein AURDEDRAFT_163535 [Auricularia subglabra TFB-10046 SS5]